MHLPANIRLPVLLLVWSFGLVLSAGLAVAEGLPARFVGDFSGSAAVELADGTSLKRDMSVSIRMSEDGFTVRWLSVSYHQAGTRQKSYEIAFVPTDRPNVYAAAMTRNVFGHAVPLDPMKGEPYVWARVSGDTLTVFSLFVDAAGGYEIQQYDRTLVAEGLQLEFQRFRNGVPQRAVSTLLTRN